jgi:hypothetical protein
VCGSVSSTAEGVISVVYERASSVGDVMRVMSRRALSIDKTSKDRCKVI